MIVVFGSINLDLIFPLTALPRPGETVLAEAARIEPGGKGANQAVAAARDGATVAMAGAVGRDGLATTAMTGLRDAGVDLSRVTEAEQATGCAAICTDAQGRNQIAVGAGANLAGRAAQVEDAVLGPGTTLLLQMEASPEETAALLLRARDRGARAILNLAPAAPLPEDALRAAALLVVNESEAAWLAATLGVAPDAAALRGALGTGVIRTLGEAGSEAATEQGTWTVPPHRVDVVDSTAAGDCYVGVLAAALDRGADLRTAMTRASAAAAICCTRAGSQRSLPSAAETDALVG